MDENKNESSFYVISSVDVQNTLAHANVSRYPRRAVTRHARSPSFFLVATPGLLFRNPRPTYGFIIMSGTRAGGCKSHAHMVADVSNVQKSISTGWIPLRRFI